MTARVAIAEYGPRDRKTGRLIESNTVVRLVVIEGSLCGLDCPHRVPEQGCNGFWVPDMVAADNGRAWRCQECADTAISDSEPRASRALELLRKLRSRKVAKKGNKQSEPEKKPENAKIDTKFEKRTLGCVLSDSELISRLSAIDGISKSIAALKARLKLLRYEVRDRSELREVECEIEFNYESHTVFVKRTDTREIIERRPMTKEEKNLELPF